MKLVSIVLAIACAAACGGDKKAEPEGPRKLSKLDVRVSVDAKGRIRPMFQLFDQKRKPVKVTGTYAIAIARRDGTELCKLDGTFAETDFTDNDAYRAQYRDAGCPADPEASDLKIAVKVESPDKTIERTLELPARLVYENLKPPAPPVGSGSAVGSATGSGSAVEVGSGSATKPPLTNDKGSGSNQAEAGPGKI